MKSAPTDVIDACADLLPFHLLVEKTIYCAATRLAALTHMHLLSKHIKKAPARYVKKHRGPLHEVMHAFKIRPDDYENISLVRQGPKWEPWFCTCIPTTRVEVVGATGSAQQTCCLLGWVRAGRRGQCSMVLYRDGVEGWSLREHLGRDSKHIGL